MEGCVAGQQDWVLYGKGKSLELKEKKIVTLLSGFTENNSIYNANTVSCFPYKYQ
jgi:hypothetical protein